jgi:hypothetical protein
VVTSLEATRSISVGCFELGYCGASTVRWLRRDAATTFEQVLDELAGKK